MAEAPSESFTLLKVEDLLDIVYDRSARHDPQAKAALLRARELIQELRVNASTGIHRNPPLVVYGNPLRGVTRTHMSGERIGLELVGQMSNDVHEIWYTHVKDGKDYHHPFDEPTAMWAALHGRSHVVMIEGPKPVWGDL